MALTYFKQSEWNCPDGTDSCMSQDFIKKLDEARGIAGVQFVINPKAGGSAYRTPEHNEAVGGVKDSAHTKGLAVDIRVQNSYERYRILMSLIKVGFNRIGIADTFIHVDDDTTKDPEVIWMY
jgi:uncharacterized protein YcbK (DUF882 family)